METHLSPVCVYKQFLVIAVSVVAAGYLNQRLWENLSRARYADHLLPPALLGHH